MEYCSEVKRNELLTYAKAWVNLRNMLSEKSQTLEYILYDSIYMKINNKPN